MKNMVVSLAVNLVAVVFGVLLWYNNTYHDTPIKQLPTAFHMAKGSHKTVVVFHKTGCHQCQTLTGSVNQLKKVRDQKNKATIVLDYANSEAQPYFEQFQIKSVPTILILKSGKVIRQIANPSASQIKKLVSE
ncbi:thioredoxin (plasmid) [Leuconostoc citreum]|uniref:Thiol-disulfide isomerase or thioredoxin n=2 Tax=Leuconostoc citreum TaxID=33964 RepID=B1N0K8_LEUCK|nr:Thiol-disulfide isomerase or thioredoxin [Leuconostoc citreum KM20]QGN61636.1 thioredoxin [Leuconostoc citreum]